jgi:hypothetical protein
MTRNQQGPPWLPSATVQGRGVDANETKDDFTVEWQLRAYAICATLAP